MHDPMVVLFDVKVPIPNFSWKSFGSEPRWGVKPFTRTNPENWGEFVYAPWRPKSWTVYMFGRRVRWTHVATIWHHEPDGRDSGTVCGRRPRGWRHIPWTVRHLRHLSVQIPPWQHFQRWAFQRCAHCGGKSRRWAPVNVSHSWHSEKAGLFKSQPGLYHSHCSSLITFAQKRDEAMRAMSLLGVTSDALRSAGLDHTTAWRVGYDVERFTNLSEDRW